MCSTTRLLPNIPRDSPPSPMTSTPPAGRTSNRESGLTRESLTQVTAAYAKSRATIVTYGMGITQHNKGTSNVRLIADLLLMRGNIRQARGRDLSFARSLERPG